MALFRRDSVRLTADHGMACFSATHYPESIATEYFPGRPWSATIEVLFSYLVT